MKNQMSSPSLSLSHDGLLQLFRKPSERAPERLRAALPDYQEARIEAVNLMQIASVERQVDLVVLWNNGKRVLNIVLEVQLERDDNKKDSWPFYVAALRQRFQCPACVMVVAATEAVARWAREPICIGPGATFEALVVGPSQVPVVQDNKQEDLYPELAVLSVMMHGGDKPEVAVAGAKAALAAVVGLDDHRALLYCDLILCALRGPARVAVEELMASGTYEYQSDFARKYIAKGRVEGEAKGKVEGRAEGKVEGRAEGKVEGRAEGEAKGEAKSVLMFLEARRLVVTDEQKQRILSCTDLEVLDRWIRKAAVATSVDELF